MTTPEDLPRLLVMLFDKRFEQRFFKRKFSRRTEALENFLELVRVRTAHQHLILNAPQEGLVPQLRRLEVSRKNKESFKGHGHFRAGPEAEINHPAFHRYDPAI